MSIKLKQKREEKDQLRIVSIVKELYTPYKFFLYGDIPLDFDFQSKKGMIFCENNSLAGMKSCKRVVKTKSFINFDLCNDEQQISDFQFLIDKIRTMEDETIHDLSMKLQNFQNRINAEKALDEQFQIIERLDRLLQNNQDVENDIFAKADQILDENVAKNPFIHYQVYRKTPYEFTTLRSGISIPGMQYFGISADSFEQSMLRDNHMPINRDEKGILLALRSLQKLNIDHAKFAKSGEVIDSEVQIKYKNYCFSVIESSKVYALSEFLNENSESNYYLVLHYLGIKNRDELEKIKKLNLPFAQRPSIQNSEIPIQKKINIQESSQLMQSQQHQNYFTNLLGSSSNHQQQQQIIHQIQYSQQMQQIPVPSNHNQFTQNQKQQEQFFNQMNSIYDKELSPSYNPSSSNSSSFSSEEFRQSEQPKANTQKEPNNQQNIKTNYQKKAQEFISSYYDTKQDEIKKQQKFDKVLENMLKKKQQKLNVKLV